MTICMIGVPDGCAYLFCIKEEEKEVAAPKKRILRQPHDRRNAVIIIFRNRHRREMPPCL